MFKKKTAPKKKAAPKKASAPKLSAPRLPLTDEGVRLAARSLGYKQEGVSADWISWAYELRHPNLFLVHDEDEDTWVKARRYFLEGTRREPSYPGATRAIQAHYPSAFDGINDAVIIDREGIGHAEAIKLLTQNKKGAR